MSNTTTDTYPTHTDETTTVVRDGVTYVLGIVDGDESVIDYVNGMDALGRLAWPVRDRYTGREGRPADFDGSAVKFGPTNTCDTVWWAPYRDETGTVYNSAEDRAFMRDLLDYGTVAIFAKRMETCGCCDHTAEIDVAWLGGIESPMIGDGNAAYLAECFDYLISDLAVEV